MRGIPGDRCDPWLLSLMRKSTTCAFRSSGPQMIGNTVLFRSVSAGAGVPFQQIPAGVLPLVFDQCIELIRPALSRKMERASA